MATPNIIRRFPQPSPNLSNLQFQCRQFSARQFSTTPAIIHPSESSATPAGISFSTPAALHKKASEIIAHRDKVYGDRIPSESLLHRFYRYCDITGLFSRWNNRAYWTLSISPLQRIDSVMTTEYERKVFIFRDASINAFIFIAFMAGGVMYYYRNSRQPLPLDLGGELPYRPIMGYLSVWPLMYPKRRCQSCRLYDPECKKACHEKLRAEGHKLFLDDTFLKAWSKPRVDLKPSPFVAPSA